MRQSVRAREHFICRICRICRIGRLVERQIRRHVSAFHGVECRARPGSTNHSLRAAYERPNEVLTTLPVTEVGVKAASPVPMLTSRA